MKCTFHLFPDPCLAFLGGPLLAQTAHFRASHCVGHSRKAVSSRHNQDARDMMQICSVGDPSGSYAKKYVLPEIPSVFSPIWG
jgi:hypothetical protein